VAAFSDLLWRQCCSVGFFFGRVPSDEAVPCFGLHFGFLVEVNDFNFFGIVIRSFIVRLNDQDWCA